jgi:hypothetical protein
MTTAFRGRADTGSRGAQKPVRTVLSATTADESLLHAVRKGTDLDQLSFDFLIFLLAGEAPFGREDGFRVRFCPSLASAHAAYRVSVNPGWEGQKRARNERSTRPRAERSGSQSGVRFLT